LICKTTLAKKEKYNNVELFDLYPKYTDKSTFPENHSHAMKKVSLFGITYLCEHIFKDDEC